MVSMFLSPASLSVSLQHLEFRRKMKVDSIISDWKPPEVHMLSKNWDTK